MLRLQRPALRRSIREPELQAARLGQGLEKGVRDLVVLVSIVVRISNKISRSIRFSMRMHAESAGNPGPAAGQRLDDGPRERRSTFLVSVVLRD